MSEFETILEPVSNTCLRGLPYAQAHKCEDVLNIGSFIERTRTNCFVVLAALVLAVLTTGCAGSNDLVPDKDLMGVPVGAVGHYGWGIGIPEYSINGLWMGNVRGWGGGLAGMCCVLLPKYPKEPFMVTVKWETYRSNVDEERHHEATIPVHFAVPPGDSSGMYVHFLPGHRVEAWVSRVGPGSTIYSGPPYPDGPAPQYVPLPDEKAQPSQAKNQ